MILLGMKSIVLKGIKFTTLLGMRYTASTISNYDKMC